MSQDKQLTDLTELTTPADGDYVYVVDVSDTTDDAAGSSRKVQLSNARGWPQTSAESTAGVTPTNLEYEPGNVLRYGTNTTPGTTDMTTAIQAAIDVASVSGGTVYIPAGTYDLGTTAVANGVTYHLEISADNVSVVGEGAATLLQSDSANAAIFLIHGGGKPAGIASWGDYRIVDSTDTTIYTISGSYSAGGQTVTTATASDAGNFVEGDLVIIRTGQTVSGTTAPDAEINEVLSAVSGTGVITLKRPLAKSYAQENFDSGSSGTSSIGGGGDACVYGVGKITDRMITNILLSDFAIDSANSRHALVGGQIDGFNIHRLDVKVTGAGLMSMGKFRDCWVQDCVCHTRDSGTTTWHVSADSACTDTWFVNNVLSSERVNYVHVLEGANRTHVVGNRVFNTETANAGDYAVSVTSRAYDTHIVDNNILNAGSSAAIRVGAECPGGVIRGNIIRGGGFTEAISVASKDWRVEHSPIGDGDVSLFGKSDGSYAYTPIEILSTWVYDDAQNPPLGSLPAYAFVTKVALHLTEVFDSDGTDQLSIGWDADNDGLLSAQDVSSTAGTGVYEFSGSQLNAIKGYSSTARDLEAYYVNGGSEPTTGKCLVVVEYVRTQRQV